MELRNLTDNQHRRISAFVIAYSDSDFTNPHTVVLPRDPEDCRSQFTHMGVKYWGLETRRHKSTSVDLPNQQLRFDHESHNWIRIGLKERAELSELAVSTKWFTGNQVRAITLILKDDMSGRASEVLTRVCLNPDDDQTFRFDCTIATECFIKLFYEGGISRLEFLGLATKVQPPLRENLLKEATISHVTNEHYGHPAMAVNGDRKEMHMVGWESARTGFGERALFHLRRPVILEEIVVDTYLHRLNAPLTCHVFGLYDKGGSTSKMYLRNKPGWAVIFDCGYEVIPEKFQEYMLDHHYLDEPVDNPQRFNVVLRLPEDSSWTPIVSFQALRPDTYHRIRELENEGPFTHLLYMHYPNGGIHGLKVFGKYG